jgi:Fur family transcriptional regulator, peroxide stress response regulator
MGGERGMEGREDMDFIAELRVHGLQVTHQRLAVYKALSYTGEHPSAETVYQMVKKRFPMISLGTVYKTLERFHDVGLIKKVCPLTEVARYDATTSPHVHMICLKCQSIQDADEPLMELKLAQPERNGFKVMSQEVLLQGYCAHCRKGVDALAS